MVLKLGAISTPQEKIKYKEPNTPVLINKTKIGEGTLYVTEDKLTWINNTTQQGFSLGYRSMHEIHTRICFWILVQDKVDIPGVDEVDSRSWDIKPATCVEFEPHTFDGIVPEFIYYRTVHIFGENPTYLPARIILAEYAAHIKAVAEMEAFQAEIASIAEDIDDNESDDDSTDLDDKDDNDEGVNDE